MSSVTEHPLRTREALGVEEVVVEPAVDPVGINSVGGLSAIAQRFGRRPRLEWIKRIRWSNRGLVVRCFNASCYLPWADCALRIREQLLRGHGADVRGGVSDFEQLLGLVTREELDGLRRWGVGSIGLGDRAGEDALASTAGERPGPRRANGGRDERYRHRGGAGACECHRGVAHARPMGEPDTSRGGQHVALFADANRARTDHCGRARSNRAVAHTTVIALRRTRATSGMGR